MSQKKPKSQLNADPTKALDGIETPGIKWKAVAQIVGAFAVLWVTAAMSMQWIGYWGLGVVGVLTLVALGFGIYIWRMTSKSREIVNLMKGATDESGRQAAIEALGEGAGKDAMKALAQAQLLSMSDPAAAQKVLEGIDLNKAPAVVQDDVRSQLGLMYLRDNRVQEARELADGIRLDRQPNPQAKALYAAVIAESQARTGNPEEARKLFETFDPDKVDSVDARAMLLRAQVYTFIALKKRGLATTAMQKMAMIEPNLLGAFLQKGTPPELMKLARQAAAGVGLAPKMKVQRRP